MKHLNLHRRLNVQLVSLLTIALFPLGSIALIQTQRVADESERTANLAVLGLTERAALGEKLLIERAVGAARLVGTIAADLLVEPDDCAQVLSRFVESNPEYSFIGVQPLSGGLPCSSSSDPQNLSGLPNVEQSMATKQSTIVVRGGDDIAGTSSFIVSEPFQIEGAFGGFVSVFIPHQNIPETSEQLEALGLVELITFNDSGKILTARTSFDNAALELPSNQDLADLSVDEPRTFRDTNRNGNERRYSIVTIKGSPAAVLAVWRTDQDALGRKEATIAPAVFPVLMWFASMGVAMLAMHSLVLRHLRRIGRQMDAFADTRDIAQQGDGGSLTPVEIERLDENFKQMSEEIIGDEARWENALREKDVLVKEIHHRVKNNLQLISSIMNMQIRNAQNDETRTVLRRVQERVLGLANIHRDLYKAQDTGRIQVGRLISEMIEKTVEMAGSESEPISVMTDIAPVLLYPDQAVPLSLLLAEATTNAMKYMGHGAGDRPILDVRLSQEGTQCELVIANSVGSENSHESTGLGAKLMKAFALQLGGKIEVDETADLYKITLRFEMKDFEPEPRDF